VEDLGRQTGRASGTSSLNAECQVLTRQTRAM
jgi:hypothetical protein